MKTEDPRILELGRCYARAVVDDLMAEVDKPKPEAPYTFVLVKNPTVPGLRQIEISWLKPSEASK